MMEKSQKGASSDKSSKKGAEWSNEDLALLIKAVNLFPAGENDGPVYLVTTKPYY